MAAIGLHGFGWSLGETTHDGHHARPWHMKFWQTQVDAMLKHSKQSAEGNPVSSTQQPDHDTTQGSTPSRPKMAAEAQDSNPAVSQAGYVFFPYWSAPTYPHRVHRRPHNLDRTFMRLVRPVILPAILGAAAGLVAGLIGILIGHLYTSLSVDLGFRKRKQRRPSRVCSMEDGTRSEKP